MNILRKIRKLINRLLAGLICLGFIATSIASADTTRTLPTKNLTEDSVNLSGQDFLANFANPESVIRTNARIYMLGVLDTTEGKSWCGYSTLKTTSINELIFENLKQLSPEQLSRRASTLIEEALHNSFPCKKTQ